MQISIEALTDILDVQRDNQPLIHCISNLVTINDLAQSILCYNGKPIIAHGIEEVNEVACNAKGLLLNLGTLDSNRVEAMEKSLKATRKKNIPVLLDIEGIDMSFFRRQTTLSFLTRYNIDILKGKLSEFKRLVKTDNVSNTDSKDITMIGNHKIRSEIKEIARKFRNILVVIDEECYVTDGFSEFFIMNGDKKFRNILGIDSIFNGAIATGMALANTKAEMIRYILISITIIGVCEELVIQKKKESDGLFTLKQHLLDEIYNIKKEDLNKMGNIIYEFKR
ncbi:hydroxyethylthiazole kinase [Clostridium chauvoei]|uniref:hydroxyethylthiazole kinase n=1 Tax=Clostridium chauvoei TaxID=46867 RepID=A0ABD4RFP0_9CLOT|nr:hydroxyethylthiazole kinase [Clostridium chauvoei]ATD55828.1 hypothetical protein BTM20_11520 [Clostridium chauvoei]MBX7280186.1 hydroxyethylthiazole kinase [Clostridium chauvoei]MBX7282704.1 hydroxyethylthiazole kinase [Clostridium chauvoei]MBX7285077.1 hydroxyethylthiazole kinase [Clostridium chauvoei]MBX7287583.1 hydroxyethylthiazole kinase [Clostridium chauvoei]